MTAHKFRVVLVAAAVAVVLALWATRVQQPGVVDEGTGNAVIPGLLERLDRVTGVSVRAGSGVELDIEREGGQWGVRQRYGYAADMEKLREYLLKLAGARLQEAKTANPANFPQLGVEDPAEEGASGVLLSVAGEGASPATLIVGRYNGQGSGTFVRYPEQSQSWLADADLTIERDPARWLRRDIADVPSSEVKSLRLVHADGSEIHAAKTDATATSFAVENVPAGRALSSEFAASGLAGFLAALRLEDVRPAAEVDVPEGALALTYETFDGRRYDMKVWDDEGRYMLTIAAGMLPASESAAETPATSDATDAAGEPADAEGTASVSDTDLAEESAAEARERVEAEVVALSSRVEGWVFQIPGFKWSAIDKRMEDLLKPLESAD